MEDELNQDQIYDAINQVKVHCDILMEGYQPAFLRGILYELGYDEHEADQVIRFCAAKGFTNCIDPMIAVSNVEGIDGPKYPSADVCHWGPDQLKSRLQCLF